MQCHLQSPSDLGAALRSRRRAFGLSQQELANAAGISRKTIGEIEATGSGRIATLFRLMQMLGANLTFVAEPLVPAPPEESEIETDFDGY
jgi:transcriptional regulator with XRE-family HTH domain